MTTREQGLSLGSYVCSSMPTEAEPHRAAERRTGLLHGLLRIALSEQRICERRPNWLVDVLNLDEYNVK
jgi:hypothetical protein